MLSHIGVMQFLVTDCYGFLHATVLVVAVITLDFEFIVNSTHLY